jgi:hypothetical protein
MLRHATLTRRRAPAHAAGEWAATRIVFAGFVWLVARPASSASDIDRESAVRRSVDSLNQVRWLSRPAPHSQRLPDQRRQRHHRRRDRGAGAVIEILGVWSQGRGVGERRLFKHQAAVEVALSGSVNTFQTLSKPKATIFKA